MKRFLRDITIRRMILSALLAISVLLAGLSAISINGLRHAGQALGASNALLQEVTALSRINDRIAAARLGLAHQLQDLGEGGSAHADEDARLVDAALGEAGRQQAAFMEQARADTPAALLTALQAGYEAVVGRALAAQRQQLAAGDVSQARRQADGDVAAASRAYAESIETYGAYAREHEAQLLQEAAARRQMAYTGMGAVLGVCLLLLVLGDRYVVAFVKRPLEDIRAHFRRIADGDLTAPIPLFGGNCVGQIIPYIRDMQDSLARTVRAVRDGVVEINTGSSEIAAGNQHLSSRTEQQAASLEQTAASMEQLLSTVTSNADNAQQANSIAAEASAVVGRGAEAVRQAVATMREISQDAGRIEDIVGVIDGIAFQTNILALNAAVEAARAGAEGKGFAVVAAEVRSLAQRSAGAAKEIKQLLDASGATVQAGSAQVETAGRTMEDILRTIERLTVLVSDIAGASHEQAAGIGQVNTALTQMDHVTQQNAALVEQAAAAAASLEAQAQRLQSAVSAFRLPVQVPAAGQAYAALAA
ncbi:HAMP domain-containing protein [Achromobacter xylosoxidans]|nr:HAMP domain-containing protein [Achromobacter xylosoxidans]